MEPRTAPAPETARLLAATLDRRRLRVLFQPLVDLASGDVIGHEALVRGPVGSPLEQPAALFAAARAAGRAAELDWAARVTAFRAALRTPRPPEQRLFVNAEPETLDAACPADLVPDWLRAHRGLRVVVELTERRLLRRPAELLLVVRTLRELGWEVALDDVGANPDGVALLPVVEPDVVKLDASLLTERPTREQRTALRAVERWAGRSGASVVAEGIESRAQLERARELGATWGQGYRFGRPLPLPDGAGPLRLVRAPAPRGTPEEPAGTTPCGLVPGPAAQVDEPALPGVLGDALLGLLERASGAPDAALLLVAAGGGLPVPDDLVARLAALAPHCALVLLLGSEPLVVPPGPLRTALLDPYDPLSAEVAAVLLAPGSTALVAARRRRDGGVDLLRSEEHAVVARAARVLLARAGAGVPALRPA